MLEENFNSYKPKPGVSSPGMLTFDEYLERKEESNLFESNEGRFPTFLQYLQVKRVKIEVVDDENLEDKIRDLMEKMDEEVFSDKMLNHLDRLINKDLNFENSLSLRLNESKDVKAKLWESYVKHINERVQKTRIRKDIQDPKYLYESRLELAKEILIEQRKIHDRIYFFTPGGRTTIDEEIEDVIGTAIIGKSKIY